MVLKFAYFVEFTIGLQSFSAEDCLGQVLERNYKTQLWHHFIILGFEVSIICETGYNLSTCQVSNPSVIRMKFYKSFYKTSRKTIMMSLNNIWLSKLHIL